MDSQAPKEFVFDSSRPFYFYTALSVLCPFVALFFVYLGAPKEFLEDPQKMQFMYLLCFGSFGILGAYSYVRYGRYRQVRISSRSLNFQLFNGQNKTLQWSDIKGVQYLSGNRSLTFSHTLNKETSERVKIIGHNQKESFILDKHNSKDWNQLLSFLISQTDHLNQKMDVISSSQPIGREEIEGVQKAHLKKQLFWMAAGMLLALIFEFTRRLL